MSAEESTMQQDNLNDNVDDELINMPIKQEIISPLPTDSDDSEHTDDDHLNKLNHGGYASQKELLSKNELLYIHHVLKCCEDEEGFDLYQLMAFDKNTKHGKKDWLIYMFNSIKAIICGLTQIFGIVILVIDLVIAKNDDWCNALETDENGSSIFTYSLSTKILSFLFSSFLAYYSIDTLSDIDKGMYRKMNYSENLQWLNQIWLRAGFSINLFVSIVSVYGSFLVIYSSESSLDMVLNSVALFFIVELDDLLVKKQDYRRINKYIQSVEYHGNNIKTSDDVCIECTICCKMCCNKCALCIGWIYTLPFQFIRRFTIISCIFIPFVVAYCY